MSVVASWSEPPATRAPSLQRAEGRARIAFKRREAASVLDQLYQFGVLRLRLPRVEAGQWAEAVLLNTAGGVTGGDRLSLEVGWGAGTAATLSGQAAERIYRALDGVALIETRLALAESARAEWLPQETIFFEGAALRRDLQVRLAGTASFLGVEALVFGRAAMGEQVRRGRLRDAWRVWRDGRLVFAEALELTGDVAGPLARPAAGGGMAAFALLLLVAPDAESRLPALRDALAGAQGLAAASAWDGLVLARFAAPDGQTLRGDILRALSLLRDGRPAPRVWRC